MKGLVAIQKIQRWCQAHKLAVAPHKTKAMLVKGNFDEQRMPTIKIGERRIQYVEEATYLGINVDRKLSFIPHCKMMRGKVMKLAAILRKAVSKEWGLAPSALNILYKSLYLPIITYGAVAWYDRVNHTHIFRALQATQRQLLLPLTRACKTASTPAMQVIAGTLPLDLEVAKRAIQFKLQKNKYVKWGNYVYLPNVDSINEGTSEDHGNLEKESLNREKERLARELQSVWQNRWNGNTHGRTTFNYLPDVCFAQNHKWFRTDKRTIQFLTGYGTINKTVFERGSIDDPSCTACGDEAEDVKHILFHCPLYDELRYGSLYNEIPEEEWSTLINSEDDYRKLAIYAKGVFNSKTRHIS